VLIGPGGGFVTTDSPTRKDKKISHDLVEAGRFESATAESGTTESGRVEPDREDVGVGAVMDESQGRGLNPEIAPLTTRPAALDPNDPHTLEPDSEVRF
jgi:hypothetical protein